MKTQRLICPACNYVNPADAWSCGRCGKNIWLSGDRAWACPKCGTINDSHNRTCHECYFKKGFFD